MVNSHSLIYRENIVHGAITVEEFNIGEEEQDTKSNGDGIITSG